MQEQGSELREVCKGGDVLDGVRMHQEQLQLGQPTQRCYIRDAIAAIDVETVVGPVTFNADGTGNVLNPLIQWQNGQLELVWPPEHATADFLYPAPPFSER